MKRILLVLTVALVMAAMVVATAAPAFAAGQHLGSPKAGQTNLNPGFTNDAVGDDANDVCFNHGNCNPTDNLQQANGEGVGEN